MTRILQKVFLSAITVAITMNIGGNQVSEGEVDGVSFVAHVHTRLYIPI